MTKCAVITGITGQDGAYLAELLLGKGYEVHGVRQPLAVPDMDRLHDLLGENAARVQMHTADLTDPLSLTKLLGEVRPQEIYNLAAQSHVHVSFDVPEQTLQVNAAGLIHILDSVRILKLEQQVRVFQASTSELFGDTAPPQTETAIMNPRSPYAAAKLYAYQLARIYRQAYGMHVSNGIMFNHESPLRGEEFVTRKIAKAVAAIESGQQECLYLGNLNASRDWSHARDIMQGAWAMLQQDEAGDYILASGIAHTVREFATEAFRVAGVPLLWSGEGVEEIGTDTRSGRIVIRVDAALFRPLEVENLLGNPRKAQFRFGWQAQVSFADLVREMVEAELQQVRGQGDQTLDRFATYG
jgi:GDPmannose 4,6-dehydratase